MRLFQQFYFSARKPPKSVDPFYNMTHMNEPGNLRPMYPKHKVYTGAGEMSLEELRAAQWWEKENKRLMEGKFSKYLLNQKIFEILI